MIVDHWGRILQRVAAGPRAAWSPRSTWHAQADVRAELSRRSIHRVLLPQDDLALA